MKRLLCFLGGAILLMQAHAQKMEIVPYMIGERITDIPIKNLINYKDSTATLSTFGNKLIILDFWNTHCTSCIKMFPLEDSLQAMFPNDVQFILVTVDSKEKVMAFLEKFNAAQRKPISLPIVTGDRVLASMFRFSYIPHYVWIAPNGQILAESSSSFISKENIINALAPLRAEEKRLEGMESTDFNLHMQEPDKNILQLLKLDNE